MHVASQTQISTVSIEHVVSSHGNARSISKKILDLQNLLNTNDLDLVTITETWLTQDITDSLINNNNSYCVFP